MPVDRLASSVLAGVISPGAPSVPLVARSLACPTPPLHMLSILMPVFNERERVERAIAEVLDTKLPTEFELIVVDD
ncbi:MAG: glycosyltransferase, partial [Solirubrobacteraceae bacterium]